MKMNLVRLSAVGRCPNNIWNARHYRDDGTCRCNDPAHKEMERWGYKWRNGRWQKETTR